MDLMQMATRLFMDKLGGAAGNLDTSQVSSALGGLLGGADGQIDLGDILGRLNGKGLGALAQSWLGDGGNEALSASRIFDLFGSDDVSGFASRLGLDTDTAASGLAGMLPELVDGNSQGGSLLDAVGGASGLMGMASKLFK